MVPPLLSVGTTVDHTTITNQKATTVYPYPLDIAFNTTQEVRCAINNLVIISINASNATHTSRIRIIHAENFPTTPHITKNRVSTTKNLQNQRGVIHEMLLS